MASEGVKTMKTDEIKQGPGSIPNSFEGQISAKDGQTATDLESAGLIEKSHNNDDKNKNTTIILIVFIIILLAILARIIYELS